MRLACVLILCATASAAEDANVVKIFTSDGGLKSYCATAFFISPTRLATAAHTFLKKTTTNHWIKKRDGVNIPVKILKIDKDADICIVETINYANPTWYPLQVNGEVRLKGFRKEELVLSEEKVSGKRERFSTDNTIIEGESGGPLVNEAGQVIGMGVEGRSRDLCISVSSDAIARFIRDLPPETAKR